MTNSLFKIMYLKSFASKLLSQGGTKLKRLLKSVIYFNIRGMDFCTESVKKQRIYNFLLLFEIYSLKMLKTVKKISTGTITLQ